MFGFGKISKPALANKLIALSVEASEQFHNYLKEDCGNIEILNNLWYNAINSTNLNLTRRLIV